MHLWYDRRHGELIQNFCAVSPQLSQLSLNSATSGGNQIVQGTYGIDSTLCFPAAWTSIPDGPTVQLLAHGVGLDKTYWDIAPGYSDVDAAASQATLHSHSIG